MTTRTADNLTTAEQRYETNVARLSGRLPALRTPPRRRLLVQLNWGCLAIMTAIAVAAVRVKGAKDAKVGMPVRRVKAARRGMAVAIVTTETTAAPKAPRPASALPTNARPAASGPTVANVGSVAVKAAATRAAIVRWPRAAKS